MNIFKYLFTPKELSIRYSIERRIREQNTNSPLSVLSNQILYILSKFTVRQFTEGQKSFSGNTTLFELGCYLFFLVDYWHFKSGHYNEREQVAGFLMDDFIRVFSNAIEPVYGDTILENRLYLYGDFANFESSPCGEAAMFFLEQLILRTGNNTTPSLIANPRTMPVTGGATENWLIRVPIQEYLIAFVPRIYDQLDDFYVHTRTSHA